MEHGTHLAPPTLVERVEAAQRHLEMSVEWKGEKLGVVEMRRHYTNYFKGIPHFKEHRIKLVTEDNYEPILETLAEIKKEFEGVYSLV